MSGYSKPNYTQLPNALLDQHLSEMKEAELKVVLAIARSTLGWHKQKDKLSLSQLMEKTGMTRQGVINGIQDGIGRGVIAREEDGMGFVYSLVVDEKSNDVNPPDCKPVNEVDQYKPKVVNEVDQSTKKTSQRSRPKVVNEVDQLAPKLVNEVDTQKKVFKEKKENSVAAQQTAKQPPSSKKLSPEEIAIKVAWAELKERREPGCIITWVKELGALRALAKQNWTPEQVVECGELCYADTWRSKNALSLWTVAKEIGAKMQRTPPNSAVPPPYETIDFDAIFGKSYH